MVEKERGELGAYWLPLAWFRVQFREDRSVSKIVITALIVACALLVLPASEIGQQGDLVSVSRASGGSVQIDLCYGIKINKESSLMHEWITVHDQVLPVDLVGTSRCPYHLRL